MPKDRAAFEALCAEIRACTACAERFGFTPHPVLQGRQDSRILQISQAPSQRAHGSGIPFSDASGRTLREQWYHLSDEVFYDPGAFYIAAIGRCFPGKAPGGGDRPPPRACADRYLQRELALVDFRLCLVLGAHAAKYLFPGQPFSALVFESLTLQGRPAYVLPHPSPLNVKWFKDNPLFFERRLPEIRAAIVQALA